MDGSGRLDETEGRENIGCRMVGEGFPRVTGNTASYLGNL